MDPIARDRFEPGGSRTSIWLTGVFASNSRWSFIFCCIASPTSAAATAAGCWRQILGPALMCEPPKIPAALRPARRSSVMLMYWTDISQPPKSTSLAASYWCVEWRAVHFGMVKIGSFAGSIGYSRLPSSGQFPVRRRAVYLRGSPFLATRVLMAAFSTAAVTRLTTSRLKTLGTMYSGLSSPRAMHPAIA